MEKPEKLLPRQRDFCRLYVEYNGRVKDAFRAAGYSGSISMAYKLLKSEAIQKEIQRLKDEQDKRKKIDLSWHQREAVELYELAKRDREYSAAAKALEISQRLHGIADPPQRHEHSGVAGGPIATANRSTVMSINVDAILGPRRQGHGERQED